MKPPRRPRNHPERLRARPRARSPRMTRSRMRFVDAPADLSAATPGAAQEAVVRRYLTDDTPKEQRLDAVVFLTRTPDGAGRAGLGRAGDRRHGRGLRPPGSARREPRHRPARGGDRRRRGRTRRRLPARDQRLLAQVGGGRGGVVQGPAAGHHRPGLQLHPVVADHHRRLDPAEQRDGGEVEQDPGGPAVVGLGDGDPDRQGAGGGDADPVGAGRLGRDRGRGPDHGGARPSRAMSPRC